MLAPAKGEGGNEKSPQRLETSGAMWATLIISRLQGENKQRVMVGPWDQLRSFHLPDTRVSPAWECWLFCAVCGVWRAAVLWRYVIVTSVVSLRDLSRRTARDTAATLDPQR